MWAICNKELRQFFGSITGYLSISVFLVLNGLFLFVFPDSNLFDAGYATLDSFFDTAPWIMLLLVPAITMRSFSEEFRTGTFEILETRPISHAALIGGKYISALLISLIAILPTITYAFTLDHLSSGSIDVGGIAGSYIGLVLLSAVFSALGIWGSSITQNSVAAFLLGAFTCFIAYIGCEAFSRIPAFTGGIDYYIALLGIESHYRSMARGVIDLRDIVYFISVITFFFFLTARNLDKRSV